MRNGSPTPLKAVIVDVDGTLAKHEGHREFFEWNKVRNDEPHEDIIELVNLYANSLDEHFDPKYAIIVMSGRDEVCRKDTEDWLEEHGVIWDHLYMRPENDNRKDSIVKKELYEKEVAPIYKVHVVIDDRQQVVDMWRELGFRVLQVAPGDF